MKRSLLSFVILFSVLVASAQVKPLTFSVAVKADQKLTQKDLYKRSKLWYSDGFQCFNKQLVLDDPAQGVIVGKGSFAYVPKVFVGSAKTKGDIYYKVRLRLNQGRYELEVFDFRHTGSSTSFDLLTQAATCSKEIPGGSVEWKNEVWADIKSQAEANAKAVIKSFIAEMSKPATGY